MNDKTQEIIKSQYEPNSVEAIQALQYKKIAKVMIEIKNLQENSDR